MSSHREAPEISKDPVADSSDVYAFVSPDKPDHVTLIANYIPLQAPAGGPNFFEFGDDVLYEIHVSNAAGAKADITYQFRFETEVRDPNTFLYNTGPITSLKSSAWNRRQFYSVTRVDHTGTHQLATRVPCPPCNVGTHSISDIHTISNEAITTLHTGEKVYAGQRSEAFYVDLGSIFDLGDLRPFQNYFLLASKAGPGVNALAGLNVHSIALQVPIRRLTANGSRPSSYTDEHATIGVWTSASRQKSKIFGAPNSSTGPWVQVSRLGNPLVNEVLIPMGKKDEWNAQSPSGDAAFEEYVNHPELAALLPVLYPKAFGHLKKLGKASRADLNAILHTGIPDGIVPGFQNYTGSTQADMLRLNTAIKPASKPSILGILGGDLAGFPNGRRPFDDVVSIELRAVAGATYPLVDKSYKPDAAAAALFDVVDPATTSPEGLGRLGVHFMGWFPYLMPGWSGFENPDVTVKPAVA